jgi:hypothetical protein
MGKINPHSSFTSCDCNNVSHHWYYCDQHLFAFTLVLNQNHTAMAQQQPTGISFQIDGFSKNLRGNTYTLYL